MAWHFVVADTAGNAIGEITNARARKASWYLDDAATASFDIDGRDPQAALVNELQTDLVVWRDTGKRFRGRLGPSSDDVSATGHSSSFSAVGYRGVLARRIIWPGATTAFSQKDQADIAWQLIADTQAQNGGNLGITRGAAPATGVLRDATYTAGSIVADMVKDLGDLTNGFDWEIDPNLAFNLWYPQRGANNGQVLVFGDNVTAVKRTLDTSKFANAIRYSGDQSVTAVTTTVAAFGPAGRWEKQVGDPSIVVPATLSDKATWELAQDNVIDPSYQVTLSRGWWDPTAIWLGDTVQLVVNSGRLAVNTTGRVSQVDLALGDDANEETITLTIGPIVGDVLSRIHSYGPRLAALERH